ncbi:MAG: hypothetical protein LBD53_00040, partial [Tannerella sp.]|nr:hypothetical protein [Tannerella sp.]
LSACEGPAGRDGLDGEGANWFVKNYQVKSNQWQLIGGQNDLNSYWQAEVVIPELTKFVYEKGNVFCYMFQNPDGNTEVQTLLPFVVPYGQIKNGNEYIWTETYACDFTVGSVMFYVNYSDFMTSNRPLDATFRVVFNW